MRGGPERKPHSSGSLRRFRHRVDQDRVGLVHQGEVEGPVHLTTRVEAEPVAQEVEPGLLDREIRDVAAVDPLPLSRGEPLRHGGDGKPEPLVDRPHPSGVPAGEVVVERQDVHPAAGERVQGHRRHRRQGLALAGLHLHELALVQADAGEHLHVVGPLAQHPAGRLAHEGEPVREEGVERCVVTDLAAQGARPLAELSVAGTE
jgi:hypothetical protein